MEYELYNTDELTHWGIKGMRWGIRRYQNKDGTLTPAGKKRLRKETDALKKEEQILKNRKTTQSKLDKLAARRKALEDQKKELDGDDNKVKKDTDADTNPTKKSVKDMTDDELFSAIRRAQMEKQYESLTSQPETIKKGNTFVKDFMEKSAVPALQEAGKTLIRDSMLKLGKKYLGLETEKSEDYVDKLGKEVKKMTLEKQYKKLKEEAAAEKNSDKGKTEKTEKAETSQKTEKKNDDSSPIKEPKTSKSENKVYEGTVEGVGNSSKTANQGKKWTNDSTIFDAEYWEVENYTPSGRSYVSDYLSLPAPRDDD